MRDRAAMATTRIVVVAMTSLMHGRAPTGLERLLGEARQCKESKRETDAPVAMRRRWNFGGNIRYFLRMPPCPRSIVHD